MASLKSDDKQSQTGISQTTLTKAPTLKREATVAKKSKSVVRPSIIRKPLHTAKQDNVSKNKGFGKLNDFLSLS